MPRPLPMIHAVNRWRTRVWLAALLLAVGPALAITVAVGVEHARATAALRLDQIAKAATDAAGDLESQIAVDRRKVVQLAAVLSDVGVQNQEALKSWMLRTAEWSPSLDSLGVADARGRILAITRRSESTRGYEVAQFAGASVADRSYFRVPLATGRSHVSEGFASRGARPGDVAFSIGAPLRTGDRIEGLAFGSRLPQGFAGLETRYAEGLDAALVVLDATDRVIYASTALGLAPLTAAGDVSWLRTMLASGTATERGRRDAIVEAFGARDVLHASRRTADGWSVVILRPQMTLMQHLGERLRATWIILVLALLLAVAMAQRLSRTVSEPLQRLTRNVDAFAADGSRSSFRSFAGLPAEYVHLARRLHRMAWRLSRGRRRLNVALEDARKARSELLEVVANRDGEIEARTRELAAANAQLERLTRIDPLTGVANRRSFSETLEREWRAALRERRPLAIALIDIDHYKAFNDCYGHQAGDEALTRVAGALASALQRSHELLARYGGEEFAAIAPRSDADEAAQLGLRLRRAVTALEIDHLRGGPSLKLTVSIGVATLVPDAANSPELLLRRADRALYAAKTAGRDRIALTIDDGAPALLGTSTPLDSESAVA